jgi:small-conductance mechanosensitive channel
VLQAIQLTQTSAAGHPSDTNKCCSPSSWHKQVLQAIQLTRTPHFSQVSTYCTQAQLQTTFILVLCVAYCLFLCFLLSFVVAAFLSFFLLIFISPTSFPFNFFYFFLLSSDKVINKPLQNSSSSNSSSYTTEVVRSNAGSDFVIPRQSCPAAVTAPLLSLRVGRAILHLQTEDSTLLQRRRWLHRVLQTTRRHIPV